jgi:rRNA maturation RNase YbeY
MATLSIRNLTRRATPVLPFTDAVQAVLPAWDISLVFATPAKALDLNQSLRNKTYTPNVLSYEVGKKNGEIVICLAEAKKQAPSFDLESSAFVLFLFIHALLHLKGMQHGLTMESRERTLLARFVPDTNKNGTTHRNRNRHRDIPDKSSHHRRGR